LHVRAKRYVCYVSQNVISRIKRITPTPAPLPRGNMNKTFRLLFAQAVLIAAGASVIGSASAAEVVVMAQSAPPPSRYEAMPAPRAGFVWDHGHWRWDHGRYVWVPGHWQHERVGYHWVPGHWVAHGPNYHWVDGHWA
jgi:hypothetical protein